MVELMTRALELAMQAMEAQEVPVGCVFTIDGNIVAESRNTVNLTHNPTRHAEMNCIDIVLEYCKSNHIDYKAYFRSISVYVTVEPCIMCAAALNSLNIKEVIYGCANDRFGGKTVLDVSDFYDHSYSLIGNVLADEAMDLLKQFYKGVNPNAPEAKAKKKK
ncbi:tRNA-specific adenosine deaminase 2-like isoform X4 [Plodia interpunctella]|uniref:tRNA-specific adenosine deaminase 2-like isoform X4 n=1 Tax=Plodia interpunctella TaxID=58824 RepID=UPI00236776DB|nr:tRNA-specific adenosine deaminase 2-like isoform X4 [Plodia interpunctella]XP_053613541.1 tRNA-specific adenosine deaminase 2-like isoform X4 [Plodia interpunctella]